MNHKLLTTISVVAVLAVLAFGSSAMPFLGGQGKAVDKTFMDSIQKAVADNDFSTWKSLMESQLTQDNFNKMVDNHKKMTQAKDLRDQLKIAQEAGDTTKVADLKTQLSALMPAQGNRARKMSEESRGKGIGAQKIGPWTQTGNQGQGKKMGAFHGRGLRGPVPTAPATA